MLQDKVDVFVIDDCVDRVPTETNVLLKYILTTVPMYRFTISAIQTQVMTDRDTIRTHMPYVYVEQVLPIVMNPASNTTVLHTDMHVINKCVCKRPDTYFDTLQIMTHYASFQTTLVHVLISPGVVRNVWLTPGSRVRMGSRCSKAIHAIGLSIGMILYGHSFPKTVLPASAIQ